MFRSLIHRKSSASTLSRSSTASLDSMASSVPATPTSPRAHDTGFPASLCGNRNTSRPHPDADLSPNASISQDDVSLSKVMSRHRRSFLGKHKRTISHGMITEDMLRDEQLYSTPLEPITDGQILASPTSADGPTLPMSSVVMASDGTVIKDGVQSIDRTTSSSAGTYGDDESPGATEPMKIRQSIETDSPKRRSFLGRFHSHR